MQDLNESFGEIVDPEMWTDVAALGAGFMGASVAQSVIDGVSPVDVPNEAYGVGVAYAGVTLDMDYSNKIAMGGGLYTIDALAQRAGVKNRVNSAVEGN